VNNIAIIAAETAKRSMELTQTYRTEITTMEARKKLLERIPDDMTVQVSKLHDLPPSLPVQSYLPSGAEETSENSIFLGGHLDLR
jgi:hypothetical protein